MHFNPLARSDRIWQFANCTRVSHIIRALQQQDMETYIPLWSGRAGNSKYLEGDLVYEKEQDRFRCPQGKYLTPTPAISENHKRYVSSSDDCRDCSQASAISAKCLKMARMKKKAGDGIRTRDIQLGKLSLCQLSYARTYFFSVLC